MQSQTAPELLNSPESVPVASVKQRMIDSAVLGIFSVLYSAAVLVLRLRKMGLNGS